MLRHWSHMVPYPISGMFIIVDTTSSRVMITNYTKHT